jgi:hypothetical protein
MNTNTTDMDILVKMVYQTPRIIDRIALSVDLQTENFEELPFLPNHQDPY